MCPAVRTSLGDLHVRLGEPEVPCPCVEGEDVRAGVLEAEDEQRGRRVQAVAPRHLLSTCLQRRALGCIHKPGRESCQGGSGKGH